MGKFWPYFGNLTSICFLTLPTFPSENWTAIQTHAVHQFYTKTHIYFTYCTCIHLNCRYYTTNQIPNMVLGDCWGFSGDLIWKAAPEVGNLTEVQGQIPYYPNLSPCRAVQFTIDRCLNANCDICFHYWWQVIELLPFTIASTIIFHIIYINVSNHSTISQQRCNAVSTKQKYPQPWESLGL